MLRPPRRAPPLKRRGCSPPPGSPASIPPSKIPRKLASDRPGPAENLTPHASRCSRLGRPNSHPFQGLGGICGPLRPLENVGPSVYRCGMRQSSSSRALPIPPVPDRHAGDMRRIRDRNTAAMRQSGRRYTTGMRAVPSIPGLPSMTGTAAAGAGERARGSAGRRPCRFGRPRARPSARRHPPSTRSAGASISAGNGLRIGAADTPGIASTHGFRPPTGAIRHRHRPRKSVATVPSRCPGTARP